MLSGLLGGPFDTFFPKLSSQLNLIKFSDIALKFLKSHGLEPIFCRSEEEARSLCKSRIPEGKWPVYFFDSDTTGEKDFEEFYTAKETVDFNSYVDIGIIKNQGDADDLAILSFEEELSALKASGSWSKVDLVTLFKRTIPEFTHSEKEKNLDQRM